MKYITIFLSIISVLGITLLNLYYNSLCLDIKMIEKHIKETNFIALEIVKDETNLVENKDNYLKRLSNIKQGLENAKTSILTKEYIDLKIKSIKNLQICIEENNKQYFNMFDEYNRLSEENLQNLLQRNIFDVTKVPKNLYNL